MEQLAVWIQKGKIVSVLIAEPLYDEILTAMKDGSQMDVIYLDFEKAFDKVDYGVLYHKVSRLGIRHELLSWITEFLSNRTQRVRAEGSWSSKTVVRSSVPQDSVPGPILFLCMMSDIDEEIEGVTVSSFAEDTRISGKVGTENERNKIQDNLQKVYYWAQQNNMSFNDSVFEVLHYGVKGQTAYK